MRKQQRSLLLALLAILTALAMVATACGDDEDSDSASTATDSAPAAPEPEPASEPAESEPEESEPEPAAPEPAESEPEPAASEPAPVDAALPGEGVSVNMARADWATGYFQAQVYKQMLEELGYEVSEPSETELGPSLAYLAMAEGDVDFWTNSWYPGHSAWWAPELPDGSLVGDHIEKVGAVFRGGGLQGMLITKSVADEYGIFYLDQINDDPELRALFDSDGDGDADIYGCQESYTCDDIITNQILFSGWDHIDQTIAGYDAMFAEAVAKAEAGEPMVIYTWTPSAYITQLRPGDNVYWIGMRNTLDDSNPSGVEGGEEHDQRFYPGTTEEVRLDIGPEQCPAAAEVGYCPIGWVPADIQVTANSEWLDANPAAAELLAQAKLSVVDVSIANVEQDQGNYTETQIAQAASEWIAANRGDVDSWISAALASVS
ncbi:MAG: glycine betaine/L-proline ABC transporter substrate-binding protein ProX [Acidimicrobiaceae bacterium]|nr:glycine betaine/L-proline ABC transporter substrate-binding protein ProX [Acidimicrobiaceae bacterium]